MFLKKLLRCSFPDRDKCLSMSSYFFIFIVWAIGGSMLGLGVFYYLQIVEIGTAVNDELAPLIIVLAVVGAVLFVTSMIGCCGLCAKQSYLLSGFLTALIIVCVAQFAAVVILFMFEASLHYYLQDGMSHSLLFYGKSGENAKFTEALDYVQENYECCGKWGWDDYTTPNASNWYSTNYGSLPDSCCSVITEGCGLGVIDTNQLERIPAGMWTQGCYQVTQDSLKDLLIKAGSAVLVFLVVEVAALFLNFSLYAKYKHDEGFRVKNKKLEDDGSSKKDSEDGDQDLGDMVPEIPEIPAIKF